MLYLLDTNVVIDYLSERYPSVIRRIRECDPEDLCTTSIVVAELRYGADKSAHPTKNHDRLNRVFAEIRCLDFDLDAAKVYGSIRASLETQGRVIGPYDMMIAAHALSLGLTLVTANEMEFRRIAKLVVENWR